MTARNTGHIVRGAELDTPQPEDRAEAAPDVGKAIRRAIATVLFPWLTSRFLFKPRVGPGRKDRALDRLAFWRSVAGLAVVMLVTYSYEENVWLDLLQKGIDTGRWALILLPLPVLAMVIVTRPSRRALLVPGVLRLIRRALIALAFFHLPYALILIAAGRFNWTSLLTGTFSVEFRSEIGWDASGADAFWLLIGILFVIAFIPWYLCFWGCTIYWMSRTGLFVGEVHPLLAPICTTVVMLLVTGREIIEFDTEVPGWLWLTLNICGTVTALVPAVLEYRHLRASGYRFREGPEPVTARSSAEDAEAAG